VATQLARDSAVEACAEIRPTASTEAGLEPARGSSRLVAIVIAAPLLLIELVWIGGLVLLLERVAQVM
jgi:hypothetical protein